MPTAATVASARRRHCRRTSAARPRQASPAAPVRMIDRLAVYDLAWAEEMLQPNDPESYAELRRATSVPACAASSKARFLARVARKRPATSMSPETFVNASYSLMALLAIKLGVRGMPGGTPSAGDV